jgi:hypothetical protein
MAAKPRHLHSFEIPNDVEPEIIKVTQTAQELLEHGEITLFKYPPVPNPDGGITEYTTTVTRPAQGWVVEAILDLQVDA